MTYFAAIFGRPAPGQLPWADRLHTHRVTRRTALLRCVLPNNPGVSSPPVIKALRMVIDDLEVDTHHDVIAPRCGAVP